MSPVVLWRLGECENYKNLGIWWYQISDPLLSCLTSMDILFSREYRNSKFTLLFPYFAKFTFWCFTTPLCQIVRWHCWILTLSVWIHNLLTPQFYFSILPNCHVHSTLWTAQMRFKLPTKLKISQLSEVWMFFLICFCWAPKNHTAPVISVFSTGSLVLLPRFFPPLSLHWFFIFFDLIDLWSLRGALSKLKFTPKIIFENKERVWLQISCFF
jgi:hypothetical protein